MTTRDTGYEKAVVDDDVVHCLCGRSVGDSFRVIGHTVNVNSSRDEEERRGKRKGEEGRGGEGKIGEERDEDDVACDPTRKHEVTTAE